MSHDIGLIPIGPFSELFHPVLFLKKEKILREIAAMFSLGLNGVCLDVGKNLTIFLNKAATFCLLSPGNQISRF